MRIDLFDVTPSTDHLAEKPRSATYPEMLAYLTDIAQRAGLTVGEDRSVAPEGMTVGERLAEGRWIDGKPVPPQYASGSYCVPMPGYGRQTVVTCDILADDGTVERSIRLPVDKRGCVPMDKAQAKQWTGLSSVRGKKAPAVKVAKPVEMAAPAPVVAAERVSDAPAPVEPPAAATVSYDALAARVAALEAALERLTPKPVAPPPAANDDTAQPVRAPRAVRERLVMAYLRMRAERQALRGELVEATQRADGEARHNRLGIAQLDAMRAERDALAERVETLDYANREIGATIMRERAAAVTRLNDMGESVQRAHCRADRLSRIAIDYRGRLKRLESDLIGAKAESQAHARRAAHARAELASVRQPASPAIAAIAATIPARASAL